MADATGADIVLEHITEHTDAKALIVVDGSADEVIERMTAAGWKLAERVDKVAGKRIRFLEAPENVRGTAPGRKDATCEQE